MDHPYHKRHSFLQSSAGTHSVTYFCRVRKNSAKTVPIIRNTRHGNCMRLDHPFSHPPFLFIPVGFVVLSPRSTSSTDRTSGTFKRMQSAAIDPERSSTLHSLFNDAFLRWPLRDNADSRRYRKPISSVLFSWETAANLIQSDSLYFSNSWKVGDCFDFFSSFLVLSRKSQKKSSFSTSRVV